MHNTSVFSLFLQASFVVQMVIVMLLVISVISWAIIFNKYPLFKRAKKRAQTFERLFWRTEDLNQLYEEKPALRSDAMGRIFQRGFEEFIRLRERAAGGSDLHLDGAERAMRVEIDKEEDILEAYLPFLATVGSTSPYVGLFGTVWGIMHSFNALGSANQATIAAVGPGIAEALIATAVGLFAAIPAVIAYNKFSHEADRLLGRYAIFSQELSAILRRHI